MKQHLTDVKVWFRQSRRFPYTRQVASSAMVLLWLVGGVTLLLATVLPHPSTLNIPVLGSTSG